jgi:glycosyltransferase involved in cell wall biosynthesis
MSNTLRQELPLRVAIDAQIQPGIGSGGIESVLIGLVHALGELDSETEEYVIVGPWGEPQWLQRYLGNCQRIVRGPQTPAPVPVEPLPRWMESSKRALGPLRPLVTRTLRKAFTDSETSSPTSEFRWPVVPVSDGFHEGLNCSVLHIPHQGFTLCAMPTIYNPHDLQHLHYPQFFSPSHIAWREVIYRAGCQLSTVVVSSEWIKQDVVNNYCVSGDKVQVIPWAPPTRAYLTPTTDACAALQKEYSLQLPFAFYPAMTWEHKNHLRLLEALALLRDREQLTVRLVCTGHQNDFWPRIERRIFELGLQQQVRFLGIVPTEDLRTLYRLAQFVIIPTLFEAASGPLFEAWQENTPVACSNVTSLPEQADNAALLFDPFSVEAVADALARMSTDLNLREDLIRRGASRLRDFSWERTAKAYRAVYRRAARRELSEEDRWLLSWDWMRQTENNLEAHL